MALFVVPQLLAADHVPEARIAGITALSLFASLASFPLTPILDWRYSRRSYAIALSIIAAVFNAFALLNTHNLEALGYLLFGAQLATQLCINAAGGWFGAITAPERKNALGAWMAVANISGFGVVAMGAVPLLRALPSPLGPILLAATILIVLPLYLWQWCPRPDAKLASESFRDFALDVGRLLREPKVLWTLPLFLAPAAAFALTNTLGGYGAQFHTPEPVVSLIGGLGATIAGVIGSLAIPPLAKTVSPRVLYLLVGAVGAAFTVACMPLPRTAAVFGLLYLGENVFQSASFAVSNIIILRVIGENNPLSSTGYGLLITATVAPITYMQVVDGRAFDFGGVNGSLLADALVSGAACLLLAAMLGVWRRRIPVV